MFNNPWLTVEPYTGSLKNASTAYMIDSYGYTWLPVRGGGTYDFMLIGGMGGGEHRPPDTLYR